MRNHFGVNALAVAGRAGRRSATPAGWRRWWRRWAAARARIGEIAAANGLRALPSATNFVAIDCGRDGAFARRVLEGLVARGIFVRKPFVAPQDRCIRVTVGRAGRARRLRRGAAAEALEAARYQ